MGITEIVLLCLGAVAYIASFVIPAKKEKLSKESMKEAEKEIRALSEKIAEETKAQIQDMVKETSDYNVEKTERAMERVCNEKIMAINEYSDTVLESINKNHSEVMFLYDMLNEKHTNLKDTAMEVEKKTKEAKQAIQDVTITAEAEAFTPMDTLTPKVQVVPKAKSTATAKSAATVKNATATDAPETAEKKVAAKNATTSSNGVATKSTATKKTTTRSKASKQAEGPEINLHASGTGKGGRNSNEQILAMHGAGKSNVAIAKELGLGIGEVKLVIDLFEGMKS